MTREGDRGFDPFVGTGTSIIAAVRHHRRGAGAETMPKYIQLAKERIQQELAGILRTRPMNKPVYDPVEAGNSLTVAPWSTNKGNSEMVLLEKPSRKQRYVAR